MGIKIRYTPTKVIQKWTLPSVSFRKRPNILGNQKKSAPNMPKMAPNAKAEEADAAEGVNHGAITEDRLAREGGEKVRRDAHARENGDVHLRMAEEPKEMLPEERRAAFVVDDPAADDEACRGEEAGASGTIEQKEDASREENAEGQQAEDGGDEPRPAGQRHAQQRHALGAQI